MTRFIRLAAMPGLVLSLVLLFAPAAHAQTTSAPTTQGAAPVTWTSDLSASDATYPREGLTVVKLDNGLQVVIKEMHDSPVVHVRSFVHTGSMFEGRWMGTGVSHLLEHLVAEGAEHDMGDAPAVKTEQKVDRIARIGGQSNAYTSLEQTVYYIEASSAKTADCVDLVSDWMTNSQISKADFQREHGVVQRELEMGKSVADRQFSYATMANLFRKHPAGVPTIGYKPALAALTYEDVLAYHKQAYVPQNMIFVVVGDVDTATVLARIRKNFAKFPAGREPSHMLPEVPAVTGTRRTIVPHPAVQEAVETLAFRTISLHHKDLFALDVLSGVLGESQSSRLYLTVFRKQKLVTSVSTGSWTPAWGSGFFEVTFRTAPELADAAEGAILAQMKDIADNGVSERELARVKRQKIAELVFGQQTVESQAASLGTDLQATGDVHFSQTYVDRIQAVTAAQVQEMARKYFDFDNMVITRQVPVPKQAATAAATQAAAKSATEVFTLPNGLRVVLKNTPAATPSKGIVSMVLVTKGGLMLETPKTNGMGTLMAALSTKGAGEYTAEEIAGFFDEAGGSISGSCGNNSFYWKSTVLNDRFEKALAIFAQVVQQPTFPQRELEIVQPAMIAGIQRIDADWSAQLNRYFRREFFKDSPYAMLSSGSVDVVKNATAADLQAYHRKNIVAGSSVLAIYGQFDVAATKAAVVALFAGMSGGEVKLPEVAARKVSPKGELHVLETKNEVAAISVGVPGMTLFNIKDRVAIDVLDTIISGYQLPSGWLHNELRGRQLVYVVHAYNFPGLAPGAFVTYAAGQPENQQEVLDRIVANLDKAARFTPTQAQIDEAVNTILTADALGNQSPDELAMLAALDELWGFGYDFRAKLDKMYRAVKPADVAAAGKKYLGKGYVVTVTTPAPKAIAMPSATQPATQKR